MFQFYKQILIRDIKKAIPLSGWPNCSNLNQSMKPGIMKKITSS